MMLDKDLGIWVMKQAELDKQIEEGYWRGYNDAKTLFSTPEKSAAAELKFFKLYENARLPRYATPGSACFDIYAHIKQEEFYAGFTANVHVGNLVSIRTGLSAVIPQGYSIRIHPRSGLAFNYMTTLINGEGIIDSDYTGEIKIGLYRFPDGGVSKYDEEEPLVIGHGDRIAQGELVKNLGVRIYEATGEEATQHAALSTRKDGGFGSTGK